MKILNNQKLEKVHIIPCMSPFLGYKIVGKYFKYVYFVFFTVDCVFGFRLKCRGPLQFSKSSRMTVNDQLTQKENSLRHNNSTQKGIGAQSNPRYKSIFFKKYFKKLHCLIILIRNSTYNKFTTYKILYRI